MRQSIEYSMTANRAILDYSSRYREKVLFDIYHKQITEGNLIPNITTAWDEVAYFQVGDNPGRNEPGTGEVNGG